MAILPENKSRLPQRRSVRLAGFDYAAGGFFITVCTADHKCLLGKIVNEQMVLSSVGQIVHTCWLEIPKCFPNVVLDQFVIMPNHIHGIVMLSSQTGTMNCAPTDPVRQFRQFGKSSLPAIVRAFKAASTRNFSKAFDTTTGSLWQRSYFDHAIRDEDSLGKIRQYIYDNPLRWSTDKENPDKILPNPAL